VAINGYEMVVATGHNPIGVPQPHTYFIRDTNSHRMTDLKGLRLLYISDFVLQLVPDYNVSSYIGLDRLQEHMDRAVLYWTSWDTVIDFPVAKSLLWKIVKDRFGDRSHIMVTSVEPEALDSDEKRRLMLAKLKGWESFSLKEY